MPFNATQRTTLRQSMRVIIDEAIENSAGPHLVETISPLRLRPQNELMTQISEDVIHFVLSQRSISSQVRDGWSQIRASISSGSLLADQVLKDLSSTPNYDPQRIVELKCFERNLRDKGLSSKARVALMRIREAYLGMTPIDNYSYGETYPTFAYHIGEVPLNLDKMGNDFSFEELQGDIEEIVTERAEIWEETQKELQPLQQENTSLKRKLKVASNLLEKQIDLEEQIADLNAKLEKTKEENARLSEGKQNRSSIDGDLLSQLLKSGDYSIAKMLLGSGMLNSQISSKDENDNLLNFYNQSTCKEYTITEKKDKYNSFLIKNRCR